MESRWNPFTIKLASNFTFFVGSLIWGIFGIICSHTHTHTYIYILSEWVREALYLEMSSYIYILIQRERERERERERVSEWVSERGLICRNVILYIYWYKNRERERERETLYGEMSSYIVISTICRFSKYDKQRWRVEITWWQYFSNFAFTF